MVYRLLREEGWFFGSSTGLNVAAAVRIAQSLGPGHRIVTILCDGGGKYQSRLFNREWLAGRGLDPDADFPGLISASPRPTRRSDLPVAKGRSKRGQTPGWVRPRGRSRAELAPTGGDGRRHQALASTPRAA
jgi:hypothetical protein